MANKFVLTAQLQLQAPTNVQQVTNQIKNQLQGITSVVDVKVSSKSQKSLAQVSQQTKGIGEEAKKSESAMFEFGKAIGLAAKRFAAYAVATTVMFKLGGAIIDATKEAIAFERELIKVAQVTGTSVQGLRGLTKEISSLSIGLGVSSKSLVDIARTLSQAGLNARQTTIAMRALAKTELAPTFDNITNTVETAVAILNQFGKGVQRLESQLGAINAVAGSFAVEASDLGVAVRRAGGAFKAAGGDLTELIALFTAVRQTTRESAETIATGFRTIFTRMRRPQTIEFLREIGVELTDLKGKFIGPYEAVSRLNKALASLDPRDVRYAQIIEELGGFRQVSKVIPLIQQFATAQRAYATAQAGANSLTEDAKTAQGALAVQFTQVREEFSALVRKITDSKSFKNFATVAMKMAKALMSIANALAPLLPLITTFMTIKLGQGLQSLLSGKAGGGIGDLFKGLGEAKHAGGGNYNRGGKVLKFARGGVVPGQGSGDTVPAMLEPGEFVIRKSSVKKIGASRLHGINKKARGGRIQKLFFGGTPDDITSEDISGSTALQYDLEQSGFSTGRAQKIKNNPILFNKNKATQLEADRKAGPSKSFTVGDSKNPFVGMFTGEVGGSETISHRFSGKGVRDKVKQLKGLTDNVKLSLPIKKVGMKSDKSQAEFDNALQGILSSAVQNVTKLLANVNKAPSSDVLSNIGAQKVKGNLFEGGIGNLVSSSVFQDDDAPFDFLGPKGGQMSGKGFDSIFGQGSTKGITHGDAKLRGAKDDIQKIADHTSAAIRAGDKQFTSKIQEANRGGVIRRFAAGGVAAGDIAGYSGIKAHVIDKLGNTFDKAKGQDLMSDDPSKGRRMLNVNDQINFKRDDKPFNVDTGSGFPKLHKNMQSFVDYKLAVHSNQNQKRGLAFEDLMQQTGAVDELSDKATSPFDALKGKKKIEIKSTEQKAGISDGMLAGKVTRNDLEEWDWSTDKIAKKALSAADDTINFGKVGVYYDDTDLQQFVDNNPLTDIQKGMLPSVSQKIRPKLGGKKGADDEPMARRMGGLIQRLAEGGAVTGRTAHVFDFDDTLATTQAKAFKDFGDPKFIDEAHYTKYASMARDASGRGEDVFILTARFMSEKINEAMQNFASTGGFPLSSDRIIGVGGMFKGETEESAKTGKQIKISTASKKAKILKQLAANYDSIRFFDDNADNVLKASEVKGVEAITASLGEAPFAPTTAAEKAANDAAIEAMQESEEKRRIAETEGRELDPSGKWRMARGGQIQRYATGGGVLPTFQPRISPSQFGTKPGYSDRSGSSLFSGSGSGSGRGGNGGGGGGGGFDFSGFIGGMLGIPGPLMFMAKAIFSEWVSPTISYTKHPSEELKKAYKSALGVYGREGGLVYKGKEYEGEENWGEFAQRLKKDIDISYADEEEGGNRRAGKSGDDLFVPSNKLKRKGMHGRRVWEKGSRFWEGDAPGLAKGGKPKRVSGVSRMPKKWKAGDVRTDKTDDSGRIGFGFAPFAIEEGHSLREWPSNFEIAGDMIGKQGTRMLAKNLAKYPYQQSQVDLLNRVRPSGQEAWIKEQLESTTGSNYKSNAFLAEIFFGKEWMDKHGYGKTEFLKPYRYDTTFGPRFDKGYGLDPSGKEFEDAKKRNVGGKKIKGGPKLLAFSSGKKRQPEDEHKYMDRWNWRSADKPRLAKGGGVGTDTVPALLTPGEFVINKESAQQIGYGKLNSMNKLATFAKGGVVGGEEGYGENFRGMTGVSDAVRQNPSFNPKVAQNMGLWGGTQAVEQWNEWNAEQKNEYIREWKRLGESEQKMIKRGDEQLGSKIGAMGGPQPGEPGFKDAERSDLWRKISGEFYDKHMSFVEHLIGERRDAQKERIISKVEGMVKDEALEIATMAEGGGIGVLNPFLNSGVDFGGMNKRIMEKVKKAVSEGRKDDVTKILQAEGLVEGEKEEEEWDWANLKMAKGGEVELSDRQSKWVKAIKAGGDIGSSLGISKGNMGFDRGTMPQVSKEEQAAFIADLASGDSSTRAGQILSQLGREGEKISTSSGSKGTSGLKATQKDIYGDNVRSKLEGAFGNTWDSPGPTSLPGWLSNELMVSNDNRILDGHHRWATIVARDIIEDNKSGTHSINTAQINLPMKDLLKVAEPYSGAKAAGAETTVAKLAKGGPVMFGGVDYAPLLPPPYGSWEAPAQKPFSTTQTRRFPGGPGVKQSPEMEEKSNQQTSKTIRMLLEAYEREGRTDRPDWMVKFMESGKYREKEEPQMMGGPEGAASIARNRRRFAEGGSVDAAFEFSPEQIAKFEANKKAQQGASDDNPDLPWNAPDYWPGKSLKYRKEAWEEEQRQAGRGNVWSKTELHGRESVGMMELGGKDGSMLKGAAWENIVAGHEAAISAAMGGGNKWSALKKLGITPTKLMNGEIDTPGYPPGKKWTPEELSAGEGQWLKPHTLEYDKDYFQKKANLQEAEKIFDEAFVKTGGYVPGKEGDEGAIWRDDQIFGWQQQFPDSYWLPHQGLGLAKGGVVRFGEGGLMLGGEEAPEIGHIDDRKQRDSADLMRKQLIEGWEMSGVGEGIEAEQVNKVSVRTLAKWYEDAMGWDGPMRMKSFNDAWLATKQNRFAEGGGVGSIGAGYGEAGREGIDPKLKDQRVKKFEEAKDFMRNFLAGMEAGMGGASGEDMLRDKFNAGMESMMAMPKFAKGGGVGTDTVPALLTPGEFVINKKSAEQIGYSSLNRINSFAAGGVVGGVQRFQDGGDVEEGGGPSALGIAAMITATSAMTEQFLDSESAMGKFVGGVTTAASTFTATVAIFDQAAKPFEEAAARLGEEIGSLEGKLKSQGEAYTSLITAFADQLDALGKQEAQMAEVDENFSKLKTAQLKDVQQSDELSKSMGAQHTQSKALANRYSALQKMYNSGTATQKKSIKAQMDKIKAENNAILKLNEGTQKAKQSIEEGIRNRQGEMSVVLEAKNAKAGEIATTKEEIAATNEEIDKTMEEAGVTKRLIEKKKGEKAAAEKTAKAQKVFSRVIGSLSAAGAAAGKYLTEAADSAIELGEAEVELIGGMKMSAETAAGLGGALEGAISGAGMGAQIGSMFGPLGSAIGGLVGGIWGAVTGFQKAAKAARDKMRKFKMDKILEEHAEVLSSALEDHAYETKAETKARRRNAAAVKAEENARLRNIAVSIEDKTARKDALKQVKDNIVATQQLTDKMAEEAGSFDEFMTNAAGLFAQMRLAGVDVDSLIESYRNQIKAQEKARIAQEMYIKSLDEQRRRLGFLTDFNKALKILALEAKQAALALSDFEAFAAGGVGKTQVLDVSDIFSNAVTFGATDMFAKEVNNIASTFGAAGQNLADEALVTGKVMGSLPDILADVARDIQADPTGERFQTAIMKRLSSLIGADIESSAIGKQIMTSIRKSMPNESGINDFVEEIMQDPVAAAEKMGESFSFILEAIEEASKLSNAHLQGMADALSSRTKIELDISKARVDLATRMFTNEQKLAKLRGRGGAGRGRAKQLGTSRQLSVLEPLDRAIAGNAKAIGGRLRALQTEIARRTQDLQVSGRGVEGRMKEIEAIEEMRKRAGGLTAALKLLTNSAEHAAAIEVRIAKERENREARHKLLSDFVFATDKARADMGQQAAAAMRLVATGDIGSIPEDMRAGAKSFLERFKDVRLDMLGGRTGGEVIQEVEATELSKMLGRPLTAKEFKSIFEKTTKEDKLLQNLEELFAEENDARMQLMEIQQSSADNIENVISTQNEKFLSELKKIFEDAETRRGAAPASPSLAAVGLAKGYVPGFQGGRGVQLNEELLVAKPKGKDKFLGMFDEDEAIIPADKTRQNRGLINALVNGKVPHFKRGVADIRNPNIINLDDEGGGGGDGGVADAVTDLEKKQDESLIESKEQTKYIKYINKWLSRVDKILGSVINKNIMFTNRILEQMVVQGLASIGGLLGSMLSAVTGMAVGMAAGMNFKQVLAGGLDVKDVKGLAEGGNVGIGSASFESKGSDTIPAMLTPGEFVINKHATSKNKGMLESINSGTQYFKHGGKPEAAKRGTDASYESQTNLMDALEYGDWTEGETTGFSAGFPGQPVPGSPYHPQGTGQARTQKHRDPETGKSRYKQTAPWPEFEVPFSRRFSSQGGGKPDFEPLDKPFFGEPWDMLRPRSKGRPGHNPGQLSETMTGDDYTGWETLRKQDNEKMGARMDRQRKLDKASDSFDDWSLGQSMKKNSAAVELMKQVIRAEGAKLGLAEGGGVDTSAPLFKPRGTDTIPAMLSPGEFVVNKKSAQANSGVLKAINSGVSYLKLGSDTGTSHPPHINALLYNVATTGTWGATDEEAEKNKETYDQYIANLSGTGPPAAINDKIDGVVDWDKYQQLLIKRGGEDKSVHDLDANRLLGTDGSIEVMKRIKLHELTAMSHIDPAMQTWATGDALAGGHEEPNFEYRDMLLASQEPLAALQEDMLEMYEDLKKGLAAYGTGFISGGTSLLRGGGDIGEDKIERGIGIGYAALGKGDAMIDNWKTGSPLSNPTGLATAYKTATLGNGMEIIGEQISKQKAGGGDPLIGRMYGALPAEVLRAMYPDLEKLLRTDGEEQTQGIRSFAARFHTLLGDKISLIGKDESGESGLAPMIQGAFGSLKKERSEKFQGGYNVKGGISPYAPKSITAGVLNESITQKIDVTGKGGKKTQYGYGDWGNRIEEIFGYLLQKDGGLDHASKKAEDWGDELPAEIETMKKHVTWQQKESQRVFSKGWRNYGNASHKMPDKIKGKLKEGGGEEGPLDIIEGLNKIQAWGGNIQTLDEIESLYNKTGTTITIKDKDGKPVEVDAFKYAKIKADFDARIDEDKKMAQNRKAGEEREVEAAEAREEGGPVNLVRRDQFLRAVFARLRTTNLGNFRTDDVKWGRGAVRGGTKGSRLGDIPTPDDVKTLMPATWSAVDLLNIYADGGVISDADTGEIGFNLENLLLESQLPIDPPPGFDPIPPAEDGGVGGLASLISNARNALAGDKLGPRLHKMIVPEVHRDFPKLIAAANDVMAKMAAGNLPPGFEDMEDKVKRAAKDKQKELAEEEKLLAIPNNPWEMAGMNQQTFKRLPRQEKLYWNAQFKNWERNNRNQIEQDERGDELSGKVAIDEAKGVEGGVLNVTGGDRKRADKSGIPIALFMHRKAKHSKARTLEGVEDADYVEELDRWVPNQSTKSYAETTPFMDGNRAFFRIFEDNLAPEKSPYLQDWFAQYSAHIAAAQTKKWEEEGMPADGGDRHDRRDPNPELSGAGGGGGQFPGDDMGPEVVKVPGLGPMTTDDPYFKMTEEEKKKYRNERFGSEDADESGFASTLGMARQPRFATGGVVSGQSGIDNVPAMLTSGEYVMRKGAVNKYGSAFFDSLNMGGGAMMSGGIPHFARGGKVEMSDFMSQFNSSIQILTNGLGNFLTAWKESLPQPAQGGGGGGGGGAGITSEALQGFNDAVSALNTGPLSQFSAAVDKLAGATITIELPTGINVNLIGLDLMANLMGGLKDFVFDKIISTLKTYKVGPGGKLDPENG